MKETWEDSEEEEEKPKPAVKTAKETWEDSDEEDEDKPKSPVKESWEQSDEEEEKPAPKAAPKAEAKPKPKPKPKAKEKAVPKPEEPLLDAQAEKLRRRQLEEERDKRIAGDLFAGFEIETEEQKEAKKKAEEDRKKAAAAKPKVEIRDAFDQLELKEQKDVERLAKTCAEKVSMGNKAGIVNKFLTELMKSIESSLDIKELAALEKQLSELVQGMKLEKQGVGGREKKADNKVSKSAKINAHSEIDEYYGEGDEWTAEEWEEWERKEAERYAKEGH